MDVYIKKSSLPLLHLVSVAIKLPFQFFLLTGLVNQCSFFTGVKIKYLAKIFNSLVVSFLGLLFLTSSAQANHKIHWQTQTPFVQSFGRRDEIEDLQIESYRQGFIQQGFSNPNGLLNCSEGAFKSKAGLVIENNNRAYYIWNYEVNGMFDAITECKDKMHFAYREWVCLNNTYLVGSGPAPTSCATTDPDPEPGNNPKNLGDCNCKHPPLAGPTNPINLGSGNKFQVETDYVSPVPNGLTYRRYYNSLGPGRAVRLGRGWSGDYWQVIFDQGGGTLASVRRPDGKTFSFHQSGSAWVSDPDVTLKLVELTDGQGSRTGWQLTLDDDTVEIYSYDPVRKEGIPISITNRAGLTTTLTYDLSVADGGDGVSFTLDRVTGPFGRTLQFHYNGGNVISITDPSGQVYTYTRDANNNTTSVIFPDDTPADANDNPRRLYHYEDPVLTNALTGITDENGNRIATWAYETDGRAILSEHADSADRVEITYNLDGSATTTNSLGQVQTYHFETLYDVVKLTQIDGDICTSCGGQFQSITYDANGFVASQTDFNGVTTTFIHDSRGLETSRTEAVGTPEERTITTTWDTTFRLPLTITEPGQITTFTYDAQGRLLERKVTAP